MRIIKGVVPYSIAREKRADGVEMWITEMQNPSAYGGGVLMCVSCVYKPNSVSARADDRYLSANAITRIL